MLIITLQQELSFSLLDKTFQNRISKYYRPVDI